MLKNMLNNSIPDPIPINNIRNLSAISPPQQIISEFPLEHQYKNFIINTRHAISNILHRKNDKLIVIVGPCSIHDKKGALEYAAKLKNISFNFPHLLIVMRVYFEKPRTTVGWKGLINDPDLNNTCNIEKGLRLARDIMISITKIGLPIACELLDPISPQYLSDLISWGAIGARTVESQIHRQLVSGSSMPVGFKNSTNGNINVAYESVIAAKHKHTFLGIDEFGRSAIIQTNGNQNCHIILRGGTEPNYHENDVNNAIKIGYDYNLIPNIMIDFSHSNSNKKAKNQKRVMESVCNQLKLEDNIIGVMIESYLHEGKQSINNKRLLYGVSITDECISIEDTVIMLFEINEAAKFRNY
tara:strand:- start:1916 stop:2986 length:1071 start_codon:yes stop_codon:yes gene_type:complete